VWATAAFQPLVVEESMAAALPLMPEWFLVTASLLALSALGIAWAPLLVCLPVAALAGMASIVQAARIASAASLPRATPRRERLRCYAITTLLHLVQPIARLSGRIGHGLTPWRRHMNRAFVLPRTRNVAIWSEQWQPAEERLAALEAVLKSRRISVCRGGPFDDWDLEVRGGVFGSARTRLGVEEYPGGRQYLRFRTWPKFCKAAVAVAALPAAMVVVAVVGHASWAAAMLGVLAALLVFRALGDCSAATACLLSALKHYEQTVQGTPAPAPASPAPASPAAAAEVRVSVKSTTRSTTFDDLPNSSTGAPLGAGGNPS
jgi:O-antigen biosynthesis protein